MGRVVEICVAAAAGAPVESRKAAGVRRGVGVLGDRYAQGAGYWRDDRVSRDLTLVSAEAAAAVGVDAAVVRRNVVTREIDLAELLGRTFRIGNVVCLGTEPCHPCKHLEEVAGVPLLRPLVGRGGLRARLLSSGTIAVGDIIERVEPADGVGVVVARGGKVLLGQRLAAHGRGTWSFPGGKPRPGETALTCALRELHEETGLVARAATPVAETLDGFDSGLLFRTTFVRVDDTAADAESLEPSKTAAWKWFEWSSLPEPLFEPVASLVGGGYDPFPE